MPWARFLNISLRTAHANRAKVNNQISKAKKLINQRRYKKALRIGLSILHLNADDPRAWKFIARLNNSCILSKLNKNYKSQIISAIGQTNLNGINAISTLRHVRDVSRSIGLLRKSYFYSNEICKTGGAKSKDHIVRIEILLLLNCYKKASGQIQEALSLDPANRQLLTLASTAARLQGNREDSL